MLCYVKPEKIQSYLPDFETSAKLHEADIKSGFKSEIGLAVIMFPPTAYVKNLNICYFLYLIYNNYFKCKYDYKNC